MAEPATADTAATKWRLSISQASRASVTAPRASVTAPSAEESANPGGASAVSALLAKLGGERKSFTERKSRVAGEGADFSQGLEKPVEPRRASAFAGAPSEGEGTATALNPETRRASQAYFQTIMEEVKTGRRASVTSAQHLSQAGPADGEEGSSSSMDPNRNSMRRSVQATNRKQSSIFRLIGKAKHLADAEDEKDAPEKPGAKVTSTVRFSLQKPEEVPFHEMPQESASSSSETSGSEEVEL